MYKVLSPVLQFLSYTLNHTIAEAWIFLNKIYKTNMFFNHVQNRTLFCATSIYIILHYIYKFTLQKFRGAPLDIKGAWKLFSKWNPDLLSEVKNDLTDE